MLIESIAFGVSGLAIGAVLGWSQHRRVTERAMDKKIEELAPYVLFDHDLREWDYIGYLVLKMKWTDYDTTSEYPVHQFVSKDDLKKRSYWIHVSPSDRKLLIEHHGFISKYIEPWRIGEGEFYGLTKYPSDWLRNKMLMDYNVSWSTDKGWWVAANEADLYKKAQKQKPKITESGNVVTVDFRSKT